MSTRLAPMVLVAAFHENAIERERCLHEPVHAPRQVLLGEFDTPWTFLRVGFHGGQLGADKIGDAVLQSTERAQLAGLGTIAAVAARIHIASWRAGARGAAMAATPASAGFRPWEAWGRPFLFSRPDGLS